MIRERNTMRKIFSFRSVLFVLVVLTLLMATAPTSFAQIRIAVGFGPPPLPVYEQPICPGDGYLWTPGYWAWDSDYDDYYWVPGTWILAPEVGYFWTPPYWAWNDGGWWFYDGYWGPQVGFYGGIVYGFGYFGVGFVGGRWEGGHFFYNRAVMNINVTNIHNVYEEKITNITVNHVSYNGGPGGISARPTPQEEAYGRERHVGPVAAQVQHVNTARGNPELRASANHGKPPIAATPRATEFSGHGVVHAKEAGGKYNPPVHAGDVQRPEAVRPNTGDANRDREFQQEQEKMNAQQDQERQQLQRQQEQEHEQMQRQNANEEQRQQMEQRHQQQTQQMEQRQFQQRQSLQQRYSPPSHEGGRR
jgi:WXXGXW repeat (2 copies)